MSENTNFKQLIVPSTHLELKSCTGTTCQSSSSYKIGTVANGNNYQSHRLAVGFAHYRYIDDSMRVKKIELKLYQQSATILNNYFHKLGVYCASQDVFPDILETFPLNSNLVDYAKIRNEFKDGEQVISYTFDITSVFDNAIANSFMMAAFEIKPITENAQENSYITVYGSNNTEYAPQIIVTYDRSYGVNTSYRSQTHDLGRFGQGSVDLHLGHLMFESEDFAWAGNLMPVTIKHLYNQALCYRPFTNTPNIDLHTADFSAMKIGDGYKLNIMQSMVKKTDGNYVYIDENGDDTILYPTETSSIYCSEEDSAFEYNETTRTLKNGNDYLFDTSGRLISITDQYGNQMVITYSNGIITSVADGIGRTFDFGYNSDGYLTSIKAPDNSEILYAYIGDYLSTVTYPNGKKAEITYSDGKPQTVTLYENEVAVYKVKYTYNGFKVIKITEYGYKNNLETEGYTINFDYSASSGRTVVTTQDPNIETVYVFDNGGEIINEYLKGNDNGCIKTSEESNSNGINPYLNGISYSENSSNYLLDHNFASLTNWETLSDNESNTIVEICNNQENSPFGEHCLHIKTQNSSAEANGIAQNSYIFDAYENTTFSAYVKIASGFTGSNHGVYLAFWNYRENRYCAISDKIRTTDGEFIRLQANLNGYELGCQVQILADGAGEFYVCAAQLENNPNAHSYNLLESGDFYNRGNWVFNGARQDNINYFSHNQAITITGDFSQQKNACQSVEVKSAAGTRETFKLSGWAKGYGLPNYEHEDSETPTFRLRAVINYTDGTTTEEPITAVFSPNTEDWQYTSVEFCKDAYKNIENIKIYCDYDYNIGDATFDDITLVRTSIEKDLTLDDFSNEEPEDDNNTEGQTEETTQNELEEFEEYIDEFGNPITETTFQDGEFGTIYRSFEYHPSGNHLIAETDSRNNHTYYSVDGVTSRNEEITDRCGNITSYQYDQSGRTTKVTSKNSSGTALANVSYSYNSFDNLTEIARGDGLKYVLEYNAFHNLESIGINGKTDGKLITYTYKDSKSRLKQMTYANGHTMKAIYNGLGRLIAEKWYSTVAQAESSTATPIAHYKYVYDGQGNIVRSIDITAQKEYTYIYEDGKIIQSSEADVTIENSDFITSRTVICTVRYLYDSENTLIKKIVRFDDGNEYTVFYEENDNSQIVRFTAGGKTVTSHSKTDSFGRKEFDELQLGSGFLSRQFSYLSGDFTIEHQAYNKLKSSPTTQLVSQIILSNGLTLSYDYDEEERITSVTETRTVGGVSTVINTTLYTYDALGQLLTEKKNNVTVNAMTYDNYGNIKTKNGVQYSYDTVWKDKLTKVGNKTISYDAQGNPTSYLGNTLTWEKGRQLKTYGDISFLYNANGIRTCKIDDSGDTLIPHLYTLDGSKILSETWRGGNILIPLYDSEDSVCGIDYNGTAYYFLKNLQGDIISITDSNGTEVAKYSYDAWGKCTIAGDTSNCDIANINPFRYRGYYFDKETGLYYLQSRYYDPEVGRFVNGDEVEIAVMQQGATEHNLFAYCGNEPVMNFDLNGYWYFTINNYYDKKVLPNLKKLASRSLFKEIYRFKYRTNLAQYIRYRDQFIYNIDKLGVFSDYIYGQGSQKVANLKFANAKIKDVGCETIAIYNVMKKLGKYQYYPVVIGECYMNGLALNNGHLGIYPKNIYKYFDAHKISYKKTTNFNTWNSRIKNKKVGILSFWNAWHVFYGLHTVMVVYKNEKYYIYNAYSDSKKAKEIKSVKKLKDYMSGSFIIGYTF